MPLPFIGKALPILLKRGGELLLVLCTWNPKGEQVTLRLDTKALGIKPTRAADAESDKPLKLEGGRTVRLPLKGYDVRILHFK